MPQTKKYRPSKAGIMLHGDNAAGDHAMILSCNEGRFAKNGEHLVLCKGSIDPGETPLVAALREAKEECGIDLSSYLGDANIVRLEQGENLHHLTHPQFPGTEIVSFKATPHKHIYHARAGREHGMWMYDVRFKGIQHLEAMLKKPQGHSVKALIHDDPQRPKFPVFMEWLRQGFIPAEPLRTDPSTVLPCVTLWEPAWFAEKVRRFAPHGELRMDKDVMRDDWQHFCEHKDNDHKALRKAFSDIKTRLKAQGWVDSDEGILKFDEKDCPLHYYVESGRLVTSREAFTKVLRDMRSNSDYAHAFCGHATAITGLEEHEKMLLGQVAGFFPFLPHRVRRQALRDVFGDQEINRMDYPLASHGHKSHRETLRGILTPTTPPSGSARSL